MPNFPKGLVLASTSPRRRQLLQEAGFSFEIHAPDAQEISDPTLHPATLVQENARLKAAAVSQIMPEAVVIGADTVVVLDARIFGKPVSMEDAERMLSDLNGRSHSVYSGVCVLQKCRDKCVLFSERSTVHFRTLQPAERTAYLLRINPLDKAGAYAAQDGLGEIIDKIEGSLSNVIGLPLEAVITALKAFEIAPRLTQAPINEPRRDLPAL